MKEEVEEGEEQGEMEEEGARGRQKGEEGRQCARKRAIDSNVGDILRRRDREREETVGEREKEIETRAIRVCARDAEGDDERRR